MAQVDEKPSLIDRLDFGIIVPVLILAVVGMYAIWLASSANLRAIISQVIWYFVGFLIVAVIMQFDSEQLFKVSPYAYAAGLTLLFLVLIFHDRSLAADTGAMSWFKVGPFTFQPSEVMKPAFILMLGRLTYRHNQLYREHTVRNDSILIGKLILVMLPVAVLLKLQNDFGTMLVFFAILGGAILVSGVTWKILLPVFLSVAVIGTIAILLVSTPNGQEILRQFNFKAYQFERINSWLDPSGDTANNSMQLWQSMKAIGSGELFGRGFGVRVVNVPVQTTDMVFSIIGESFGFVGVIGVILTYFYLIFNMVKVAFQTRNAFYSYVSTGVIMMILFHVFENIGMSIDLLPLTGIPLPFISSGGSALLGNMIGVGLILSMKYHHKSYIFSGKGEF
ncbi:FtsW/RodA/SpoVE family cell cycle protein [Holzapfeliella sp. JNUCC 80]